MTVMEYKKLLVKNSLFGNYDWDVPWYVDPEFDYKRMIRGDLRAVESEALSPEFLTKIDYVLGVSKEDAEAVLRAFFGKKVPGCEACQEVFMKNAPVIERCDNHNFKKVLLKPQVTE
jgi:hypothetical protein